MKTVTAFVLLFLGVQANAKNYECRSSSGISAKLSIVDQKSVEWFDLSHSASSQGVSLGQESAPFSEWIGYQQFQLTDFYNTNDSMFVLAIESKDADQLKAIVYFDNDDHTEEIEYFQCLKVKAAFQD